MQTYHMVIIFIIRFRPRILTLVIGILTTVIDIQTLMFDIKTMIIGIHTLVRGIQNSDVRYTDPCDTDSSNICTVPVNRQTHSGDKFKPTLWK